MTTINSQPQFVTKLAFTVVGLRLHTIAKSPQIPQLWDQLVPRMGEIQHAIEPHVSYGLMDHFNQATGTLDYMAGNPVEKVVGLPAGMSRWDVPANTYAVFETTIPTLGETFDHIFNTWLPISGYQQIAGPYFERYGADFSPDHPVLSIYIPVKPVEKRTNGSFVATTSIVIDAPSSRVWDALTQPDLIKHYLFGTQVTTDWKVGSSITYTGVWQGKAYEDKGQVLQVEPGKLLVSTFWSSLSGVADLPENYQTVCYELAPDGAGTRLTVTQDNNATQDAASHSEQNWAMVLDGMKKLLEG